MPKVISLDEYRRRKTTQPEDPMMAFYRRAIESYDTYKITRELLAFFYEPDDE